MGAQGSTTLNFGAFPGSSDAVVDVVAVGVVASSAVEAWILPVATADHSVDEHMAETIKVVGTYLSDGNIRIRGFNTNQIRTAPNSYQISAADGERMFTDPAPPNLMLVGQFTVGWVWN